MRVIFLCVGLLVCVAGCVESQDSGSSSVESRGPNGFESCLDLCRKVVAHDCLQYQSDVMRNISDEYIKVRSWRCKTLVNDSGIDPGYQRCWDELQSAAEWEGSSESRGAAEMCEEERCLRMCAGASS